MVSVFAEVPLGTAGHDESVDGSNARLTKIVLYFRKQRVPKIVVCKQNLSITNNVLINMKSISVKHEIFLDKDD